MAARQRVEILRALYRGARVLVLDEPTAVLTVQESEALLAMLAEMAASGLSVVLISHKMPELLQATRRVTVLRDGQKVGTVLTADATAASLAAMMVGRETDLRLQVDPVRRTPEPVLQLRGVSDKDARVRGVGLEVYGGEIVGIAGVEGSGQRELVELVAGLRALKSGEVMLSGKDISRTSPNRRLGLGLGYVPEDRSTQGLVLDLPIFENAALRRQRRPPFRRYGVLSRTRMRTRAGQLIESYDVRASGVGQRTGSLSGGNQQKLLMGRETFDDPLVLLVSQPTRGVDINAAQAIHLRLLEARRAGRAVLLDSLDLDEVKALCDRIVVMFRGEVAGSLDRADVTDEAIGLLMTGAAS